MKNKTVKDFLLECSCFFKTEHKARLAYSTIVRDIRRLLLHIKNRSDRIQCISYEDIVFYPEKILLTEDEISIFFNMLQRYIKNEPISKIINKRSFWKHDFYINGDVLDPRQETELIVESVLKRFDVNDCLDFLDIGTGSGCILLSLLSEFKNSKGIGIDISANAINIANYNQKMLNVENAEFINIGWNDLINKTNIFRQNYQENQLFDVIVSNPPYIRSIEIASLDENVRKYDPIVALDGGNDGLAAYCEISKIVKSMLHNKGMLFLEVGYDQAYLVKTMLEENGFSYVEIVKDLNKIERVVIAQNLLS